jgi:F-type H+-transporting ATPase subunit b
LSSSRVCVFLLILLCLASPAAPARALQAKDTANASQAQAPAQTAPPAQNDEEAEKNVYRHSSSVTAMGHWFRLDQEPAARLFEWLNFAVMAGVILVVAAKFLPKTFRANREQIRGRLVEARIATEHAQERLAAIEQRLAKLDEEIAAISRQAEKDSVEDEARIKASIAGERERIVAASSREIAAAANAAQRDLKRFATELAVDRAAQRLVLTADDDHALIQEFSQNLGARNGGKH